MPAVSIGRARLLASQGSLVPHSWLLLAQRLCTGVQLAGVMGQEGLAEDSPEEFGALSRAAGRLVSPGPTDGGLVMSQSDALSTLCVVTCSPLAC